MDGSQQQSGFTPEVWNQLEQAAQQTRNQQRGRGRGRGRGNGRGAAQHVTQQQMPLQGPLPAMDAFPPLGASHISQAPAVASSISSSHSQNMNQQRSQPGGFPRQTPRMEFFDHSRGSNRGRQYHQQPRQHTNAQQTAFQPPPMRAADDFRRPPAPQGRLYQQAPPSSNPAWSSWSDAQPHQRNLRQQGIAQSDYLNFVQQNARDKYQLKKEESIMKEDFRKHLEKSCQDALVKPYPILTASDVRLRCYGSLNNGFGLAKCDMDLLLALPEDFKPAQQTAKEGSGEVQEKLSNAPQPDDAGLLINDEAKVQSRKEKFAIGWLLEDMFLEQGIGARLLTQTRVPILRICEKPGETLLKNLKKNHQNEMKAGVDGAKSSTKSTTFPPSMNMEAIQNALSDLEDQDSAAEVALPDHSEDPTGAELEFPEDCGIKCDVNFSNFVAIHNTRLLREYCLYDPRVAEVGVFVKTWAKLRDINTPYWGTLSSYGYVLMALHYLMNICSPPVIPNLQHLALDEDSWKGTAPELFEGKYDIRFWTRGEKLDHVRQISPQNRETTGSLLRGFFWYYATYEGFNFKNDIISIRTKGGVLRKNSKGWTEGKWVEGTDKNKVRQRYLFAIEDPFEVDHNIGRVVGHHGIVAIRDEFRRAWNIISKIDGHNAPHEDLLKPAEQRGDLLHQDSEHRREQMRKMRKQLEDKEQKLKEQKLQENGHVQENGMSSDDESSSRPLPLRKRSGNSRKTNTKLTENEGNQNRPLQSKSGRVRLVKNESDSDGDDEKESSNGKRAQKVRPAKAQRYDEGNVDAEMNEKALDEDQDFPEPFCANPNVADSTGFDAEGNPIAWPATPEGRWLVWRDRKIRKGWLTGVSPSSVFYHLHLGCPYHPHRPVSEDAGEYQRYETLAIAPFPLQNDFGVSSSEHRFDERVLPMPATSVNAAVGSEGDSADTSMTHLPATEATLEGAVGWPIAWDLQTRGGRWLRKRDIQVRSRQFRESQHLATYRFLHHLFPCNPEMSHTQLEAYNVDLRAYHMHTIRRMSPSMRERKPNAIPARFQMTTVKGDLRLRMFNVSEPAEDGLQEYGHAPMYDQSEVPALPVKSNDDRSEDERTGLYHSLRMTDDLKRKIKELSPTEDIQIVVPSPDDEDGAEHSVENGDMPDVAFLRSRRLAFYAQQEKSESTVVENGAGGHAENIRSLMEKVGLTNVKPIFVDNDSGIAGIWANNETSTHNVADDFGSEGDSDYATAYGDDPHQHNDREHTSTEPANRNRTPVTAAKVPSTLYPNLDRNERPRDEDPDIMPIPRDHGFAFDVRQLRDLAVIKEGGNGCARKGSEFEVEDDYEWGGGGGMGQIQGSMEFQHKEAQASQHQYEYGQGDEDGLLDELPACGFDD